MSDYRVMIVFAALVGCGSTMDVSPVSPLDGQSCTGFIDPAPEGSQPADDAPLLQAALGKTGEGKLCAGQVLEATQPLAVYRVWNQAKDYTEFGSWWSFIRPTGPADHYREDNAICPEWSELNQLTVCTLKVGAHFVMGPGQSASCMMMMYGKSGVNQIYIPNDTRASKIYVEGCMRLGAWPQ